MSYDECLEQNHFFKAIQENYPDIIRKAQDKGWIICVPRAGSFDPSTVTAQDIYEHILVQNEETQFTTLTKRKITVQNRLVKTEKGEAIDILFDETFYVGKSRRYKLWCMERPLHLRLSNHKTYHSIKGIKDCIKLLWKTNNSILDDINKVLETFLNDKSEFDDIELLEEKVSNLYKCSLELVSNQSDNVNLAVETYIQHCIHHKLFPAICNYASEIDSRFNKIHRNLLDISLNDLEIENENITSAKRELSYINTFSTALGKLECLHHTFKILAKDNSCLTTDVLLKIFVFLIIKSNLNNWIGNLTYLSFFRFSTLNVTDEYAFLITNLEAAIEYVKSESIQIDHRLDSNSRLGKLFSYIKEGNLELVRNIYDSCHIFNTDKTPLCHPLCSCDKCESLAPFNIDSCDDKGLTALHRACLYGQPHIVEFLLDKNVEINVPDYSEFTPLHYASLRGHQNALLLLLHANALISPRNCDGNVPLHLAANNGHENCLKALLYFSEQKGIVIDVNLKNNLGDTALHYAAKWGYDRIVDILLQYGANVHLTNKRSQSVFDVIHNDYLRKVLTKNVEKTKNVIEINPRKSTEKEKQIDLVLRSIANNDLPLMCFYLGLPVGISPITNNINTKLACHPLCSCEKCANQFEVPKTQSSSSKTLNINSRNSDGYSPLHIAAKYGHKEILRALLDYGALINVKTYKQQSSPLHLACLYQRTEIVRELLQCGGCDLDVKDAKGNAPLHYACSSNNGKIVELLLSRGSNCKDSIAGGEGEDVVQYRYFAEG